jgi:hypothetical protein
VRVEAKCGPGSGKPIGVHDAAVETDFYRVESDDSRRVHEVEHIIGLFERAAGYAFANLDKLGPGHFPDDVDRESLSMFMALQFVRGPDTSDFGARFCTDTTRMGLRVAATAPEVVRNILSKHGEDTSDEAVARAAALFREGADAVSVSPHKNEIAAFMLRGIVDFMPYFFQRRWAIVRSPIPLLTSDRPIVLLAHEDPGDVWHGVGLETADVIVYALDRRRALFMQHPIPGHLEGVVDINESIARWLNIATANRARRWIFYHPEDAPLGDVPFNPNPNQSDLGVTG